MFGRAILVGGLLAVLWFGFSPTPVLAQNIAGFAGCDGPDCSACNIINLANEGLQWFIGFLFVLFALLVAWAGAQLVVSGGNHHALDEAKDKFTNAIVGLLIILAAWLVVDTIMRGLVGQTGHEGQVQYVTGWLAWSEVQCFAQTDPNEEGVEREGSLTVNVEGLDEAPIDNGTGNAGTIIVNTPAGPQAVDVRACDESQLGSVNFLGTSIRINRQFIPSLQRIDARWRQMGASRYRVTSVGGYNCRNIAGTNRRSNHAYGIAVDINPAQNPHTFPGDRNYGQTNMPPEFVQLFRSEGWGWGGNWNSSKDTMHFSKATGEGGNMRP